MMQDKESSTKPKPLSSFRAPIITQPFQTKKLDVFGEVSELEEDEPQRVIQIDEEDEDSFVEAKRVNIFRDLDDYDSKSKGLKMFKKF